MEMTLPSHISSSYFSALCKEKIENVAFDKTEKKKASSYIRFFEKVYEKKYCTKFCSKILSSKGKLRNVTE